MKRIFSILLIVSVALIAGCYYDSEEKLYPVIATSCDLANVTYSVTVKTILQASCYTCHSNSNYLNSGGGIKLENYADVLTVVQNGKLMGSVKHLSGFKPMPDGGGKLSDCEISQLQKWIDNGKLNN